MHSLRPWCPSCSSCPSSPLCRWCRAAGDAQISESVGIRAQGMGGAFVAVADDATATWWNPAGLAGGAYFNAILEFDQLDGPCPTTQRPGACRDRRFPPWASAITACRSVEIRPPTSTGPSRDREPRRSRALLDAQFGVTVGQSLGDHLVVASTLKLHAARWCETRCAGPAIVGAHGRRSALARDVGRGGRGTSRTPEFGRRGRRARAGAAGAGGRRPQHGLAAA